MSTSRRKWITGGLSAAAGVTGIAAATKAASAFGWIPPDHGGLYGIGETLNYAAHKAIGSGAMAREFTRAQMSEKPFPNPSGIEKNAEFNKLQAASFVDWKLTVDGLVERPMALSIADLKGYPRGSHITQLACEEGWSYVAEWIGAPLAHVLDLVGAKPAANFVVYESFQKPWWDSIDIEEARHPQTLIAHGFNGADLPVGFGGPLRMRVPRQLGYKSVKFINHITLVDDVKKFRNGKGSFGPEVGYTWYAGI